MSNVPAGPTSPPGAPGPQPAKPPRRRGPLVVGLGIGTAVLLAVVIGAVHWLSPAPGRAVAGNAVTTPAPTSPRSSGSTSRSATAGAPGRPSRRPRTPSDRTAGSPQNSPRGAPDLGLTGNSLYRVDLSGDGMCRAKVRRPKPPLKDAALGPYLRTVVACLVDAFRAPLAREGFTLATPAVKTFRGSVTTPCGRVGSHSNPAFYCGGTIYWPLGSDDGRQAYTFARLGYVGLLAHEFGHHLQATTGMLNAYGSRYQAADRTGRLALSRRLELQAECFEGVFLSHDRAALHFSSRDRRELRTWHSYTGDEDPPSSRQPDHGTSKAQLAWLDRGLAGADFGRCNTWSAPATSVR